MATCFWEDLIAKRLTVVMDAKAVGACQGWKYGVGYTMVGQGVRRHRSCCLRGWVTSMCHHQADCEQQSNHHEFLIYTMHLSSPPCPERPRSLMQCSTNTYKIIKCLYPHRPHTIPNTPRTKSLNLSIIRRFKPLQNSSRPINSPLLALHDYQIRLPGTFL